MPATVATIGVLGPQGPPGSSGGSSIIANTSALTVAGVASYLDAMGFALPTDSLSARASSLAGVYAGTAGMLATAGIVTCRFTTDGGAPPAGAAVYLAACTDDSGAGAGKLTATMPQPGPLMIDVVGFSGTTPRNAVPVGRCVDASLYASTKTATVELALPTPRAPAADLTFNGYEYSGFSGGNNFTAAGTSTGTTFHDQETAIVLFTVDTPFSGSGGIVGNADAGNTRGWAIGVSTNMIVVNWATGVLVHLATPKAGVNCLVASIHDGALWASLNGGPIVKSTAAVASILDPDGTCTFSIGTAFGQPWTNGGVLAAAGLSRAASGADMTRWSAMVFPTPPASRFDMPPDVVSDAALKWYWSGRFITTVYGFGFSPAFTLTKNGTPTKSVRTERWYRNPAPLMLDTAPPIVDTHGVPRGSPMARIAYTAPAAQPDLCLGIYCDDVLNWDNDDTGVLVDGSAYTVVPSVSNGTYPSTTGQVPDGQLRYYWLTYATNAAPNISHHVEIITGSQTQGGASGSSVGKNGGYVVELVAGVTQAFDGPACNKRLVLVGDDFIIGQDGLLPHNTQILTTLIRGDFPTTGGPGRVTAEAAVERSLFGIYTAGGNSVLPFARQIVADGIEGGPSTVLVYIQLGLRDYTFAQWGVAAFGAQYQALINAVHALQPTWSIYAQKLIQVNIDAIANAEGDTGAAYNAAIGALTGCTVVDARVPNAISFQGFSPQIVPSPAGTAAWKANIKLAIGY